VDAHADYTGVHVAFSDHEHGVDFHLLGALNFAVDLVVAVINLHVIREARESQRDVRGDVGRSKFFRDPFSI
jgi:hypothetical protein